MKPQLPTRNRNYWLALILLLMLLGGWGLASIVSAVSKSQSLTAGSTGEQSGNAAIANNRYSLCPSQPQGQISNTKAQFYPMKLVVEPWRGEHNVYAIFALPSEYFYTSRYGQMVVKGTETIWDVTIANPSLYNLTTPDGYFLVIGFFRTRVALWHLMTGRFDQLQQPCNWVLHL